MKKIIFALAMVQMLSAGTPIIVHAQSSEGGIVNLPAIIMGGGGGGRRHAVISPEPAIGGQVLGAVTFSFIREFGAGSNSDDVTELQKILTSEGVYTGPITGYFGKLTAAGVKAYQAKYGISQTGFVGPITLAKLNNRGAVLGVQVEPTKAEQIKAILAQLQSKVEALFTQLQNSSR